MSIQEPPICPKNARHGPMKLKVAQKEPYKGNKFYGCTKFPACRGLVDYSNHISSRNASSSSYTRTPNKTNVATETVTEVSKPLEVSKERLARIEIAAGQWANSLIDRSGNNRLVYYKPLKVGTLELSGSDKTTLGKLLSGRKTQLSKLFPDKEEEDYKTLLKKAQRVLSSDKTNFEEKGIHTLFLAVGMATWVASKKTAPNAPIFLRRVEITRAGKQYSDYTITLSGDWEINQALKHHLNDDFGIESSLLDQMPKMANKAEFLEFHNTYMKKIEGSLSSLPGFKIKQKYLIGNFKYSRQPMVNDIRDHTLELAQNDIICALAGDEEAQSALRDKRTNDLPPLSQPDITQPLDEFLVLDADSSQNQAINSVLRGQSIIVQGPPGTGKSQTIANLIATLAARGKSVLFVAEKRAAIDAVTKRLDQVGLRDYVMDLHGNAKKGEVAKLLARTLDVRGSVIEPYIAQTHSDLTTSREKLNQRSEYLQKNYEPWDISFFDLIKDIMHLRKDTKEFYLPMDQVMRYSVATRSKIIRKIKVWSEFANLRKQSSKVWLESKITTEKDVEEVSGILNYLHSQYVREACSYITEISSLAGVAGANTLERFHELLETVQKAKKVLDKANVSIFLEDLHMEIKVLEFYARNPVLAIFPHIFSKTYRAAKSKISNHLNQGVKKNVKVLYNLATTSMECKEKWGGTTPQPYGKFKEAQECFTEVSGMLADLHAFLPNLIDSSVSLKAKPLEGLQQTVEELGNERSYLNLIPKIIEAEAELNNGGLGALMQMVYTEEISTDKAVDSFDLSWKGSARSELLKNELILSAVAQDQDTLIEQFTKADNDHIRTTPERVKKLITSKAIQTSQHYPKQEALIQKESRKKRQHKRLQDLLKEAPELLTAIRPCWTMSPLEVSQVLPITQVFDAVIFDEASQIIPAEAIPALLRGKQVIIAGDSKQLPPTTFFEGEVDANQDNELFDFESILDVLDAHLRSYLLNWHYRSKDERLIAFSNHEIYNSSLHTFPGASGRGSLKFEKIPQRTQEIRETNSNPDEVERAVNLMIEHALERPNETLGCITMGSPHADKIIDELYQRLASENSSELNEFFDPEKDDRAFVKSIESVQGDERDAIIISIGYRKKNDGTLSHNFGPINQEGGERRINVAVTRARRRLTLLSSFLHSDIDLTRSKSFGVKILKRYLEYVEFGGEKLANWTDNPQLNTFELEILQKLQQRGLQIIPQYGVSRYRLDFAVKHPKYPDVHILDIEADGATYHSSPTARDRDRLRDQHLESLGWAVHRIWSTDWFKNPEAEIEKAIAAYEATVELFDIYGGGGRI